MIHLFTVQFFGTQYWKFVGTHVLTFFTRLLAIRLHKIVPRAVTCPVTAIWIVIHTIYTRKKCHGPDEKCYENDKQVLMITIMIMMMMMMMMMVIL